MAFTERRMKILEDSVRKLYARQIAYKSNDLTPEDLLELFVRPEHRQMVVEVVNLCGVSGQVWFQHKLWLGDAGMVVGVNYAPNGDHPGFAKPSYCGKELHARPDSPALRKLTEWASWRLRMGQDWGLVLAVLIKLNSLCGTPSELRFIWPSILPLLSFNEATRDAAVALEQFRTPRAFPTVPGPLLEASRHCAGVIAKALLLPNPDLVRPDTPVVQLWAEAGGLPKAENPWAKGRFITPM